MLVVILGGVMLALIDFLNPVNDGGALMAVRGADFLSVTFLVEADRVTGGAKFSETFGNAG